MKKILAIVLAFAMILGVCLLAGCDNTPAETTTGKKQPAETTTGGNVQPGETTGGSQVGAPTETTGGTDDPGQPTEWDGYTRLPGYEDVTFQGAVFNIAVYEGYKDPDYDNIREVYSDKTDQVSVAANERTRVVEQLYDCDIVPKGHAENPNTLASAAATGGEPIHLVSFMDDAHKLPGSRYNLYSLDLDLTQEWWNQDWVNSSTINKTDGTPSLYTMVGDFSLGSYAYTVALMFNQTLYDNMIKGDFGSIYDYVRNGTWTMDVFTQMMYKGSNDANGDSTYATADGDILGWISTDISAQSLHVASGLPMLSNDNGKIVFAMYDNAVQWDNVMDKAIEVWQSPYHEYVGYGDALSAFVGGKGVFYSELLSKLETNSAKNAENLKVSVVPFPKVFETQTDYSCYVQTHYTHYAVPIAVQNIDEVADFFTVYAAHSTKIVRPAWLDTYAYDYLSGAESREMLERVLDSRTFDPADTYFDTIGEFNSMITSEKNNLTQMVQRRYNSIMGDGGYVSEYIKKCDNAAS